VSFVSPFVQLSKAHTLSPQQPELFPKCPGAVLR